MVDSIRAVQRALSIVRLLAEEHKPLGVAEVSQATGLPPATAHRLLVTLVEEGWVDQDPQSTQYELGPGILGTAAVAIAYSSFIQAAKVTLTDIAEVSNLNTYLGVRVGYRVAYLASVRGREGHDAKFRVGVVEQAHAVADGKVLLADLPEQEVRRLYAGRSELRRYTPKTVANVDELLSQLPEIRRAGKALDIGERTEGWNYVAVPVRGRGGHVEAAIVCGGQEAIAPVDKLQWLAHEMRLASEQLSLRLGFGEE
jgi:IclR family acetate operon transcriptional repressor